MPTNELSLHTTIVVASGPVNLRTSQVGDTVAQPAKMTNAIVINNISHAVIYALENLVYSSSSVSSRAEGSGISSASKPQFFFTSNNN
jgi:hypothetical protein